MRGLNISDKIKTRLRSVFSAHPSVKEVYLFGSRARGDHKINSDIDLFVISDDGVSGKLWSAIDDSVGLYKVDVVDPAELENDLLLKFVDMDKVLLYRRDEP